MFVRITAAAVLLTAIASPVFAQREAGSPAQLETRLGYVSFSQMQGDSARWQRSQQIDTDLAINRQMTQALAPRGGRAPTPKEREAIEALRRARIEAMKERSFLTRLFHQVVR